MTRAEQLADAYEAIARTNHYMVGIVETVTETERDDAEQILITRQNAGKQSGAAYKRLDLALDLIEHERRTALTRASQGT
jgi:hypothetical protein